MEYILGILGIMILVIIAINIKIVPQSYTLVIERLGAFHMVWQTGLHVKIPFIEKVAKTVSLKEQVYDFPPHAVITKDNVTMQIDTIVFCQVTDPKLFTYGVENPIMAIANLSTTTCRNIVGELELDQTLTSRDIINSRMREIIDEATNPWGIKVNRVELKGITPPAAIQDAMEKQMRAEREKRSSILTAEGMKQAAILEAEGEKQSAILKAEAVKEAKIREAEGEAKAILTIQQARADGIKLINESKPSEAVLRLEAMEAFKKAADGKSTKLIVPTDISSVAGLVGALKEVVQ